MARAARRGLAVVMLAIGFTAGTVSVLTYQEANAAANGLLAAVIGSAGLFSLVFGISTWRRARPTP